VTFCTVDWAPFELQHDLLAATTLVARFNSSHQYLSYTQHFWKNSAVTQKHLLILLREACCKSAQVSQNDA